MRKIVLDFLIAIAIVVIIAVVYQNYGAALVRLIAGEQPSTMFVKGTPISVSIADEPHEHVQGLSGVKELNDFGGKLFVFPKEDFYGMWMKDMFISLDILWIDDDFKIVHIEKNVKPETYPDSFVSTEPARFVLEVNAFFAESENIRVGDEVRLPATAIPEDLVPDLQ